MNDIIRLLTLMKPYAGWMALGVLASCVTLFANITLMAVSGWFITSMALAGLAGVSMNYFSPAAIIRAMSILRTVGRYLERLITHEATFRLLAEIRVWFYQQLEPLVPEVIENYRSGDLFSRIQADIENLDNFYIRVLIPFIVMILAVTFITWFVASYDLIMGLVIFIMLLIAGMILPLMILKWSKPAAEKQIEQATELRTHTIDFVQAMPELMVTGAIDQQTDRIQQSSDQLITSQVQLNKYTGLSGASLLLITGLAMWFIILLAIPMVRSAELEPAKLAMLALFTHAAFEAVVPMPEALRLLNLVKKSARRLFELIDQPVQIKEPDKPLTKPDSFHWHLKKVSFTYPNQTSSALIDVDLDIKPGKKIAIIGSTGAGKSSLISLFYRHRQVQNGEVLLSDQPIASYASKDLQDWISLVPQKPYLFNASIEDNLKLANPKATAEQIQKVLDIAQLQDLTQSQQDGLQSWVGETGLKLSGGQVKRLAIARAMLKPFELLILDEPTEGLDNQTSEQVMDNIFSNLNGKSLLMITHQLSGLDKFDEVIRIENGNIIK